MSLKQSENPNQKSKMKRRLIPLLLMLAAGAVSAILMYLGNYELHTFLRNLFLVLFVFYLIGRGITALLDRFDKQNAALQAETEEVIEKEAPGSEEGTVGGNE